MHHLGYYNLVTLIFGTTISTSFNILMKCFLHLFTCTCIALRGVLTSVLQESQGLITYDFVMLLLAMISLHMLTFRLMVTMVVEFCSLVILIHNTLLGEITISVVHELQGLTKIIPLFPSTYFHMQRFNFIDFMVIELRFFKKKNNS